MSKWIWVLKFSKKWALASCTNWITITTFASWFTILSTYNQIRCTDLSAKIWVAWKFLKPDVRYARQFYWYIHWMVIKFEIVSLNPAS
jgi:hypothetical protein